MSDSSQATVLIIDDDESHIVSLTKTLANNGFNVLQAKDGKPGLERALEHHPDIILLDLIMPEMDGVNFMKLLREDSWGAEVPVVIFTNVNPDAENTIKMIEEYKPSFYLVKGEHTLEEIANKIKSILYQ